jgi:hypothetical protein
MTPNREHVSLEPSPTAERLLAVHPTCQFCEAEPASRACVLRIVLGRHATADGSAIRRQDVPCACCQSCYSRGRRLTWLRRLVWVYLFAVLAAGVWGMAGAMGGLWGLVWFALFIPIFVYLPLVCYYPMMRLLAPGLRKSLSFLAAIPWTMLTLPFVLPWPADRAGPHPN